MQFILADLILLILPNIIIDFVNTQLNVKTVVY